MTIPTLRGLTEETANLPGMVEGIATAINPKFPLQQNLLKNISDPRVLQAFANLEAQNPGIVSSIFGGGNATNAISQMHPDLQTQLDIQTKPQILQTLTDPAAIQEYVSALTKTKTPAERKSDRQQLALMDQQLKANKVKITAAKAEAESIQSDTQRKLRIREFLAQHPKPLTLEEFKNLPAQLQADLASEDIGRSTLARWQAADDARANREYYLKLKQAENNAQRTDALNARLEQLKVAQATDAFKRFGGNLADWIAYYDGGAKQLQLTKDSPNGAKLIAADPALQRFAELEKQVGASTKSKIATPLITSGIKIIQQAWHDLKRKNGGNLSSDDANSIAQRANVLFQQAGAVGVNAPIVVVKETARGGLSKMLPWKSNKVELELQMPDGSTVSFDKASSFDPNAIAQASEAATISKATSTKSAPINNDPISIWRQLYKSNPKQFNIDLGKLTKAQREKIMQKLNEKP